eukprot:5200148-Alexandrium_andersonii.AAC.1
MRDIGRHRGHAAEPARNLRPLQPPQPRCPLQSRCPLPPLFLLRLQWCCLVDLFWQTGRASAPAVAPARGRVDVQGISVDVGSGGLPEDKTTLRGAVAEMFGQSPHPKAEDIAFALKQDIDKPSTTIAATSTRLSASGQPRTGLRRERFGRRAPNPLC